MDPKPGTQVIWHQELDWLPIFLAHEYHIKCKLHLSTVPRKRRCNLFCTKCKGAPFCKQCLQDLHVGHEVLTVRKVNRRYGVWTSEIENLSSPIPFYDITLFRCNGKDHLLLSPKIQDFPSTNFGDIISHHSAESGGCKSLKTYCSLNCKNVDYMLHGFRLHSKVSNQRTKKGSKASSQKDVSSPSTSARMEGVCSRTKRGGARGPVEKDEVLTTLESEALEGLLMLQLDNNDCDQMSVAEAARILVQMKNDVGKN